MDGVNIPFLPTGLWLLASATTIAVLIIWFAYDVFNRRRVKAILGDGKDVADLAAKKQILQADVEAIREWENSQKAEIEHLTAEREDQERLRSVLADLEQQCAKKEQENQDLRNEVGELENQRHIVSQTLDKMEQVQERYNGEIQKIEALKQKTELTLSKIDTNLSEKKKEAERLSSEVEGKNHTMAGLEKTIREQKAEVGDLEHRYKCLLDKVDKLQEMEPQFNLMKERLIEKKQELDDTREELAIQQRFEDEAARKVKEFSYEADELGKRKIDIENKLGDLKEALTKLEAQQNDAEEKLNKIEERLSPAKQEISDAKRELADVQKEKQRLDIDISELSVRKVVLNQEIAKAKGELSLGIDENIDSLTAYTDLLNIEPTCLNKNSFVEERETQDETSLLQKLKINLREEGLIFSPRIINAFHTSLKCHDINPITVLAGVSGTGKTLLPMRYAEMMGMHLLVMAVQPRWDSPQDMFGFYNYLEKEYKATELSRSLVRLDLYNYNMEDFPMLNNEWTKDRLLLILLDEMNLARTEYYFSEFLSKLELRRMVSDPSDPYKRSHAEIELDTGPGPHRFRLWVGHNVFFVGTLNEDETTQSLSDKVLDRANVIRFGKPDEKAKAAKHNTQTQATNDQFLSFDQWRSWHRELDESAGWYEQVVGWTQRLNAALDRVGRPFGFRVQQAIGHYVANYPRFGGVENYQLAFADQVEQKIITKLRGIDIGEVNANECLSEVEMIIDELGDTELGDSFAAARSESENLGMFQWRGVTRRMEEDNS